MCVYQYALGRSELTEVIVVQMKCLHLTITYLGPTAKFSYYNYTSSYHYKITLVISDLIQHLATELTPLHERYVSILQLN